MPRLIPLYEWTELVFGKHKPCANTLTKWVREGRIRPFPKKVGRTYFVDPKAEYVDEDAEMLERML